MISRRLFNTGIFSASAFFSSAHAKTLTQTATSLDSDAVGRGFSLLAQTGSMPAELHQWLSDPVIQKIAPYQVFDNVWYVGLRWVASYLIKTEEGYILIDTLHEPFVGHLIDNLSSLHIELENIKYVLMTHGHFDHVGGAATLKPLLRNAHFVMSAKGWQEAQPGSKNHATARRMIPKDMTAKDGDIISLGKTRIKAIETPGHTWGTLSYQYPVFCDGNRYEAVTIGGLGLNAIESDAQLKAYIASLEKLAAIQPQISVDMTAHPFSNHLTEKIELIKSRKKGESHPLVNRNGFVQQLDALKKNAQMMLQKRQKKNS